MKVECNFCGSEFTITDKEYTQNVWKKFWCSSDCRDDDPQYHKLRSKHPGITEPEKRVMTFINEKKLPYRYTGNGKFWIEKVNPDFVNTNGEKKAIEVFGCYWHKCPKCYPDIVRTVKSFQTEQGRKALFRKYGWDVIILWEHQLIGHGWKNKILEKL